MVILEIIGAVVLILLVLLGGKWLSANVTIKPETKEEDK
jgi:hypothetical protein